MFVYIVVPILLLLYLYYNERYKCSRQYKLIMEFPSLGVLEVPVLGAVWRFLGGPERPRPRNIDNFLCAGRIWIMISELMEAIAYSASCVTRLGGAARIYLFTYYYIVLTDAHDAAVALKTCLDKDYLYKFMRTFSGNGSAFVSGPLARERRSVLMPSFHPRILFSFLDVFWEESVHLTNILASHAGAGPFSVELYFYKYNIRSVIRSGIDTNKTEIYDSNEFFGALTTWERIAKDRMASMWKHPDCLYKFSSQYDEGQRVVEILHSYAKKILYLRLDEIQKHRQQAESVDSGASYNYGIFDPIINSHLEEVEKREEIIVLIIGTDLVGLSMGFTLMLLAEYPGVQEKVYRELNDIFGGSDRPVTKEDLEKMNYMDMVIKESMRLFPPVPAIARKVLKDVTLPSGRTIPAGSGLFTAIWGIHRNPKYWGPDADSFDPDRFSPERIKGIPPQAFMPFSFGPRNCVGYKFGQISMKVALSTILRRFKIVGKPAAGLVPELETKLNIFMRAKNNFQIQLVNRN